MAGIVATLLVGTALVMVWSVQCNEDIVSVISRIDDLDEDVIRVEEQVIKRIDWVKISLRSELKQHITEHVREAIAGILQGESIEEMVRSQVISEVRQLRRGNHQMKRQLHRVLMSLSEVRQEQRQCCENLQKTDRSSDERNICSKYVKNLKILERDLERCETNSTYYREQADQKEKEITELKQSLQMLNQSFKSQLKTVNTVAMSVRPSTASTSTATPVDSTVSTTTATSSLTTTSKPEENRNRIIIAPLWDSTQRQFLQLDMNSNTVSTYPLRGLKQVVSIAYVSKLKKLLIGLYGPNKIVSSNLDSYDIQIMRENVESHGMAVDEEREILFVTTVSPRNTVSRMTTRGKHFTVIKDLRKYSGYLYGIAVNSKKRMIYISNFYKILMLTYDGSVIQTLATGSYMLGLTLDNTGDILYFNDYRKLMKMSLSQNVSEVVTTLNVEPWNIRYYMNSLYFSSFDSNIIGTVNVTYDTVSHTLYTVKDSYNQAICLVP